MGDRIVLAKKWHKHSRRYWQKPTPLFLILDNQFGSKRISKMTQDGIEEVTKEMTEKN